MKIHTFIPYDVDRDLGSAYNKCMDLLDDDAWAVFLDHDAMFVQPEWMLIIQDAIERNKTFGFFTCRTNRIGSQWQKAAGIDEANHDIRYHRRIGRDFSRNQVQIVQSKVSEGCAVEDATELPCMSGVVMIVKKSVWTKIGGAPPGMLGVDGQLHLRCRAANVKLGLIKNLYVYHWYRGDGSIQHLHNDQGY